ncbi:hypothetical protein DPEC_G00076570 [Dallia pectoralis]|uniref:Uncharacterized protein n=1 Tax=Dallia pectoralis TaxID=75939 RepID=A0ACC2H411_DALPE|nr:hypothetical protein DPEC_G00076570 [Dallia pectoralis]
MVLRCKASAVCSRPGSLMSLTNCYPCNTEEEALCLALRRTVEDARLGTGSCLRSGLRPVTHIDCHHHLRCTVPSAVLCPVPRLPKIDGVALHLLAIRFFEVFLTEHGRF